MGTNASVVEGQGGCCYRGTGNKRVPDFYIHPAARADEANCHWHTRSLISHRPLTIRTPVDLLQIADCRVRATWQHKSVGAPPWEGSRTMPSLSVMLLLCDGVRFTQSPAHDLTVTSPFSFGL